MKDKIFIRVVAVMIALGIISSAALIGYTIHLHDQCSIITYISNESE